MPMKEALMMIQESHSRTKHIYVRNHFVRNIIDDEIIFLSILKINNMVTKVATSIKFKHCLNLINITQVT